MSSEGACVPTNSKEFKPSGKTLKIEIIKNKNVIMQFPVDYAKNWNEGTREFKPSGNILQKFDIRYIY